MTTTTNAASALLASALPLLAACGSMPTTPMAVSHPCLAAASPAAPTAASPPAAESTSPPQVERSPAPPMASAACPVASTAPDVHTISIAPGWQDSSGGHPAIDAVEGEAAGADGYQPAGTVLVAESRADREPPETITEYDLASGREVREVSLPITGPDLRMARAGDMVHVFAWSDGGDLRYAALSLPELRVVRVERLATGDWTGLSAVATDGRSTVVATTGTFPKLGEGFVLVAFDQRGRRIGTRRIDVCTPPMSGGACPSDLQDNVVVVGGRPYVLLETDDFSPAGRRYRLLRLHADLSSDKEWAFDAPDFHAASIRLAAWRNLVALDTSGVRSLDILFDLSPREVTRQPRCTDPPPPPRPSDSGVGDVRELWVDHVHVALHGLDASGKAYLTWVREAASGPPAPCWANRVEAEAP